MARPEWWNRSCGSSEASWFLGRGDGVGTRSRRGVVAPGARPDRRRGRRHRQDPRPAAQPPRAGHVRGDVVRALLLQVVPHPPRAACRPRAPRVLVGPGENAGVIDVGDGIAVAIRIESHNHPSAIEPYQGAATGVGGILRDIFTMGARPIALMDPLALRPARRRPQPLDRRRAWSAASPATATRSACPTVGGEVVFDETATPTTRWSTCSASGVLPDRPAGARAGVGRGQPGRAARLDHRARRHRRRQRAGLGRLRRRRRGATTAKRPSVQVGDPFEEKRLIEACLDAARRRPRRRHPGPRRRRPHLRHQRDGRPGRRGHGRRRRRPSRAASRAWSRSR